MNSPWNSQGLSDSLPLYGTLCDIQHSGIGFNSTAVAQFQRSKINAGALLLHAALTRCEHCGLDTRLPRELVSAAPAQGSCWEVRQGALTQAEHVGLVSSFMLGFPAGCAVFKNKTCACLRRRTYLPARLVSRFCNFRHFGYPIPLFSSSSRFNTFWQTKQFG